MRALIIDDSRAARSWVRLMMVELGFDTVEAPDGWEGLQSLHQHWPLDLILVDWNMPELDGHQFVQTVRADPLLGKVPMMMVTSEVEMERLRTALDAGVDEYLMKPFTKEALSEKLGLMGLVD
ncbi:MAG: response regulator [Planctomycetota bacterium]